MSTSKKLKSEQLFVRVETVMHKSKSGTIWSVKTRILYSVTNASESCLLWKYTLNK